MKLQLPIKGISSTPAYEGGDAHSLVNLRYKGGSLTPVLPRKKTQTLTTTYDKVFKHKNNLLLVKSGKVYFGATELCSIGSNPILSAIGNVVNITSSSGIQYLIWYQGEYIAIDTRFDGDSFDQTLPPIQLKLRVQNTFGVRIEQFTYAEDIGVSLEILFYKSKGYWFSSPQVDTPTDKLTASALMRRAVRKAEQEGYITGHCLAIYAIELYDGTVINHSQPILLNQAWDRNTRYSYVAKDYITNPTGNNVLIKEKPGGELEGWHRMGSKDYTGVGGPVWVREWTDDFAYQNVFSYKAGGEVRGGAVCQKLQFCFNDFISDSLKPLIRAVNIYLTPQVLNFKLDDIYDTKSGYSGHPYLLPRPKTNEEVIEELLQQQFYKVKEIPYTHLQPGNPESLTEGEWIDIDMKDIYSNLVNQEMLPLDPFSHHTTIPEAQTTYNSRLHIMNYKIQLSRGFPLNYFYAEQEDEQYEGVNYGQVGKFPAVINSEKGSYIRYTKVKVKTENGISEVVRHSARNTLSFERRDLNPAISYPDERAIEITAYDIAITGATGWGYAEKKVFRLVEHEHLNAAIYIAPDLKPITNTQKINLTSPDAIPSEVLRELVYEANMKVSQVNNPFVFPLVNTYTVGTGTILNAASNAMAVSEGQFGQFPLYVFTTTGIYALQVGTGEVIYTTQAPVSQHIPINSKLLKTPYGIVFVAQRGLMIISGQQAQYLIPKLELPRETLTLPDINKSGLGDPFQVETTDLATMLADANLILAYNPAEDEIIITKTNASCNFVVREGIVYLSTEKIKTVVENTYPSLLVTETVTVTTPTPDTYDIIKDFSLPEANTKAKCSFILRPLRYGTEDYKRLERVVIRCTLMDAEKIFTMIHAGVDGSVYKAIRGFEIKNNTLEDAVPKPSNFKDVDLKLTGLKYRYYVISLGFTAKENSKIELIECEVTEEGNKLR